MQSALSSFANAGRAPSPLGYVIVIVPSAAAVIDGPSRRPGRVLIPYLAGDETHRNALNGKQRRSVSRILVLTTCRLSHAHERQIGNCHDIRHLRGATSSIAVQITLRSTAPSADSFSWRTRTLQMRQYERLIGNPGSSMLRRSASPFTTLTCVLKCSCITNV
jgi:hypothetical protein